MCTSSFTLRRAKIALLFFERLGFADLRSVYFFFPGPFVLFFTGGDFFRIGLIYLEFRVPLYFLFCCVLTLGYLFPGEDYAIFILFRV